MHPNRKKLIQDVIPLTQQNFDTVVTSHTALKKLPTEVLIEELYRRKVTVERVFMQYYALEEMGNHSTMTVGDVELAGLLGNNEDRTF